MGPGDEKVTINVTPVDLGKVDLLIGEGLYASRTDFIRAAIRRQLDGAQLVIDQAIVRRRFTVGYHFLRAADLEQATRDGLRLSIRVIGVLQMANDVTPNLADAAIKEIRILGAFKAPAAVKERLRHKTARTEGEQS